MYQKYIKSKDKLIDYKSENLDANFSKEFGTDRVAFHWVELLPNQTSSKYAHAESLEEECVYILSGRPHVWVNGFIYQLEPGFCVGFPAGTGIAHLFINNTNEKVELVVFGDRTKAENKCSFPINPEVKSQYKNIWWDAPPAHVFGGHRAEAGDLDYQKNWQELPFIKNILDAERKIGFSYEGDCEKFTLGIRITDHVGLKSIGAWHEILKSGHRSAWPHAHKIEEEALIIIKGYPKVWMNGLVYDLNPGDCVYFQPATGIAHVIINDGLEDVEYIGLGEACENTDDKVYYPLHQTRNEQCIEQNYFWTDCPKLKFGDHLGIPFSKNIEIKFEKNASDFLNQATDLLYAKEAEYNLILGLCETFKVRPVADDKNSYITIYESKKLVGAALITPVNLVLTHIPPTALLYLAESLYEKKISFPGVVGPAHLSEAFAQIWSKKVHKKSKLTMNLKNFRLEKVNLPTNVVGSMIVARDEHTSIVAEWLLAFVQESVPHEPTTLENTTTLAKAKINRGEVFLWIDETGVLVSMSNVGRGTQNGINISGVYTPKHLRGNGYASGVVAHSTQRMLDLGKKFCVLYTNAHNPTSNKIYQYIGYQEIAISKQFMFN